MFLYTKNQFDCNISRLCFDGSESFYTIQKSLKSPELSCEGSYRKCFQKDNSTGQYGSDIFVYKRGRDDASNAGLEPYSEMLSSQIAQIISPNSVSYELVTLHNKTATRCNLFTSEKYGYVPCKNLVKENTYFDFLDYFCKHNAEQEFREMILIDALCFNEDRHKGNFGMLFDNDTLELVRMSPIFDLNISLLTYHTDDKLLDIGNALYSISPKIGEDFTAIGQEVLNNTLRNKLKDMKDFTFF